MADGQTYWVDNEVRGRTINRQKEVTLESTEKKNLTLVLDKNNVQTDMGE